MNSLALDKPRYQIVDPSKTKYNLVCNDDNTYKDINKDNKEQIENECAKRNIFDTADGIINFDIPVSDELGSSQ